MAHACASTRKSRRWFNAHNIPFVYKDIMRNPLSVEEIQHILRLTEQGTKDIISTRSKVYKQLNINLETIPLQKLYSLIREFQDYYVTQLFSMKKDYKSVLMNIIFASLSRKKKGKNFSLKIFLL